MMAFVVVIRDLIHFTLLPCLNRDEKMKHFLYLLTLCLLNAMVYPGILKLQDDQEASFLLSSDASEEITTNRQQWLYWQFLTSRHEVQTFDKPMLVAGFATNLCILSYSSYTTFEFSYMLLKNGDDAILFNFFTDIKCQNQDSSSKKVVSFKEFQTTINQTIHVYNNSNIEIAFSPDETLPLPSDYPYATNFTYNNRVSCKTSNKQQRTKFISYAEKLCMPIIYPTIDQRIRNVMYKLPKFRYFSDPACKLYSSTRLIPANECLHPGKPYESEYEFSLREPWMTLDIQPDQSNINEGGIDILDSIVNQIHESSPASRNRQIVSNPAFDDDDWLPPTDDAFTGDDLWKQPFQVFEKWETVINPTVPTSAPVLASYKPTLQPTLAPSKFLLYYQFTVIQQLLNVQIDTLIADELSRAVFSKAVSVLVGLPYSAIHIINITDTYQPSTTYLQLSDNTALTTHRVTTTADPFVTNNHLSLIAELERSINNSVLLSGYLNRFSDAVDGVFYMFMQPFSTQPSCFVTYNIVFSPVQLNHTDPNEAYQQIRNQLTKRAVTGVQTISIKYFATNKNSTSLLKVNARSAPTISGFTILPSDIPNYPAGHSTTDNVMAITVLSLTIAGGITILLTFVWFVSCISGSVRVFVDNNFIGTAEPQFVDVEMAPLVVDGEPPAVVAGELRQEHERTQVEVFYAPDQADDDRDLSVHSLQEQ